MLENLKVKAKNKGFWVSLASALIILAQSVGVVVNESEIMTTVNAVLGVLILLGIISDSSKGKWYADKEEIIEDEQDLNK